MGEGGNSGGIVDGDRSRSVMGPRDIYTPGDCRTWNHD